MVSLAECPYTGYRVLAFKYLNVCHEEKKSALCSEKWYLLQHKIGHKRAVKPRRVTGPYSPGEVLGIVGKNGLDCIWR